MLIKQSKTNIRYLLIVVVLAAIVGGGALYCCLNFPEYKSPLINFLPKTEKEVEDETANWKVYRNEEYGFELKYPIAFTSTSTGPNFAQEALNKGEQISGTVPPAFDVIVFHDKDGNKFSIEIYHQPFNKLDQNYVYGGECGSQFAVENIINQIVNINGIDFLKRSQVIPNNKIRIDYCFLSGTNNLIALRAENLDSTEVDKISDLFNRMLSTFRLVD